MTEYKSDLAAALEAMTLEHGKLLDAEQKAERRLAELEILLQKIAGDLSREGASLAGDSKLAVDASSTVLEHVTRVGGAAEIRAAEDLRRLVVALHASAWNVRAYATYFQSKLGALIVR